jgi:hypothetical protein
VPESGMSKEPAKSAKPKRVITPIDDALLKRVENYRFAERCPSESAAIRALLDKALTTWEKVAAKASAK